MLDPKHKPPKAPKFDRNFLLEDDSREIISKHLASKPLDHKEQCYFESYYYNNQYLGEGEVGSEGKEIEVNVTRRRSFEMHEMQNQGGDIENWQKHLQSSSSNISNSTSSNPNLALAGASAVGGGGVGMAAAAAAAFGSIRPPSYQVSSIVIISYYTCYFFAGILISNNVFVYLCIQIFAF